MPSAKRRWICPWVTIAGIRLTESRRVDYQVKAWLSQASSQISVSLTPLLTCHVTTTIRLAITGATRVRDSMMTSSNGNISVLLAICAGNSPVDGEFPAQRPVTRSFDVFFGLHPNKRLSKQSWGWWFKTLSCSLWRHCTAGEKSAFGAKPD